MNLYYKKTARCASFANSGGKGIPNRAGLTPTWRLSRLPIVHQWSTGGVQNTSAIQHPGTVKQLH